MQELIVNLLANALISALVGYMIGVVASDFYSLYTLKLKRRELDKRQEEFNEFITVMKSSPVLFNSTIKQYQHLFDQELMTKIKNHQSLQVELQMKYLSNIEEEFMYNATNIHQFPIARREELSEKIEKSLTQVRESKAMLLTQVLGIKI
ncbi:MAG: hypothetical protein ACRCXZ_05785 [Patescibacteria group bacterium]